VLLILLSPLELGTVSSTTLGRPLVPFFRIALSKLRRPPVGLR
jgi:hypothetical protein